MFLRAFRKSTIEKSSRLLQKHHKLVFQCEKSQNCLVVGQTLVEDSQINQKLAKPRLKKYRIVSSWPNPPLPGSVVKTTKNFNHTVPLWSIGLEIVKQHKYLKLVCIFFYRKLLGTVDLQ